MKQKYKSIVYYAIFTAILATNISWAKQPNFKIDFVMDKNYDKFMIYCVFRHKDPAGLSPRAKSMGIDIDTAKTIKKSKNYWKIISIINKLVNTKYSEESDKIDKSIKEYALSWETIIETFAVIIPAITEQDWFYKKYICVVSPFHPGLSNWYGNKIVRKYNEDPIEQRRITAHEIVLSHIFHIVRKYYKKDDIGDWKVWKFAEISTVFVLDDKKLGDLWPWYTPPDNYFSRSNYPQLAGLENKLKVIYAKRESFKDYLDKSIKILRDE